MFRWRGVFLRVQPSVFFVLQLKNHFGNGKMRTQKVVDDEKLISRTHGWRIF